MEVKRQQDVIRSTVVKLEGRNIPRNENGDPSFNSMEEVYQQFEAFEVLALVNRQLYQMEYQRTVHRNRAANEREQLKPIKELYKEMYGKPFTKATNEELDKVMQELKRRKKSE